MVSLLKLRMFIIMSIFLSHSFAFARMAKGAAIRKDRDIKLMEYNIDDIIRAENDPNFAEYLKERQKQTESDQDIIAEYKKQRLEFEKQQEAARLEYLEERKHKKIDDNDSGLEEHLREETQWQDAQESARRNFISERTQESIHDKSARDQRYKLLLGNRIPTEKSSKSK